MEALAHNVAAVQEQIRHSARCCLHAKTPESTTDFISEVRAMLEAAQADSRGVANVLSAVQQACSSHSEGSKELLELFSWDLLPLLAGYCNLSKLCQDSFVATVAAMAQTCSAQEMTTLFLGELKTASNWVARLAMVQGLTLAFPRVTRKPTANLQAALPLLLSTVKVALDSDADEQEGVPSANQKDNELKGSSEELQGSQNTEQVENGTTRSSETGKSDISEGQTSGADLEADARRQVPSQVVKLAETIALSCKPEGEALSEERVRLLQVVAGFVFNLTACLTEHQPPPWPPTGAETPLGIETKLAEVLNTCGIMLSSLLSLEGIKGQAVPCSSTDMDTSETEANEADFYTGVALTVSHAVIYKHCYTALQGPENLSRPQAIRAVSLAGHLLEQGQVPRCLKGLQLLEGAARLAGVSPPQRGTRQLLGGHADTEEQELEEEEFQEVLSALKCSEVPMALWPVAELRSYAHHAMQMALSILSPPDRLRALEALLSDCQYPAIASLLLNRAKDEVASAWPPADSSPETVSMFVSPKVLRLLYICLKPDHPLESGDTIISALNFLRFLLLRERACESNYTDVRSKATLTHIRCKLLLPIRVVAARSVSSMKQETFGEAGLQTEAQTSEVLVVDTLQEVLHRVIELVEEELRS